MVVNMEFMRIRIFSFLIEVENLCVCRWVLMGVFCLEALDTQSVQSLPNNAKVQRPTRVRSTPSNHSNLKEIQSSSQAPPLPP